MFPLVKALQVYYNQSYPEYRNFLLDYIKLLFKTSNISNHESFSYLPDYIKDYIISKVNQFKLKALIQGDFDQEVLAIKFFNSFMKNKEDKIYALLFIKHLYNFYINFQNKNRKSKHCVIYVDNIKIVFEKEENPFYNFEHDRITRFHSPSKNIIFFWTISSCEGKIINRFGKINSKIKAIIRVFNFHDSVAILFIYEVVRKYSYYVLNYIYGANKKPNLLATEMYFINKNNFETFFSRAIFYDEVEKNQFLNEDFKKIFNTTLSKHFTKVNPEKSNKLDEKSFLKPITDPTANKWLILEKITNQNSRSFIFTLY